MNLRSNHPSQAIPWEAGRSVRQILLQEPQICDAVLLDRENLTAIHASLSDVAGDLRQQASRWSRLPRLGRP